MRYREPMAPASREVTVRCPNCAAMEPVPADATEFPCGHCGEEYRFLRCPHCTDSAPVSRKLARRNKLRLCPSCRLPVRNPQWLPARRGSAQAVHDHLESMGTLVDDPDLRSHGGFYVVGAEGAYADFKHPMPYSLVTLADEVRLVRAGSHETLAIDYERLTDVQITGEDKTMGRYFHDRFGLAGAAGDIAVGMLAGQHAQEARDQHLHVHQERGRPATAHAPPHAGRTHAGVVPAARLALPAGGRRMSADATVARFMASLETEVREVAPGEWGLTLDAVGYPLEVGVIIRGSFVRAQAAVLPAGVIDPHQLLYWNRQAPFVCFAENRAGEVFVCGELALESLSAETLDQFLGLLLASAARAREFAIKNP